MLHKSDHRLEGGSICLAEIETGGAVVVEERAAGPFNATLPMSRMYPTSEIASARRARCSMKSTAVPSPATSAMCRKLSSTRGGDSPAVGSSSTTRRGRVISRRLARAVGDHLSRIDRDVDTV